MNISIELTNEQSGHLLQLLDIAVGGAPVGQRLQVADVALPIAVKVQRAQQANPATTSPPSEVASDQTAE